VPQGAFAQQLPVHSFDALQIKRGQLVIVKGDDGNTVRSVVARLADGGLDVEWRNWRFKKQRRSFTEQSAQRIELHDTTVTVRSRVPPPAHWAPFLFTRLARTYCVSCHSGVDCPRANAR
jgi:hypothetical protein